jgi:hypothetical protein
VTFSSCDWLTPSSRNRIYAKANTVGDMPFQMAGLASSALAHTCTDSWTGLTVGEVVADSDKL